jgi:GNAT superfamily N-acetyltransferase
VTDLLVRLYDLPDPGALLASLAQKGIAVRRAMACEKGQVVDWVRNRFGAGWAAECDVAFARLPIACMVAVQNRRLLGFACHDSTCANFFGPIGVEATYRHQGVGRALLQATLHAMAQCGYAYAIIGAAGPVTFFEKSVGAIVIPESTPGIYRSAIAEGG